MNRKQLIAALTQIVHEATTAGNEPEIVSAGEALRYILDKIERDEVADVSRMVKDFEYDEAVRQSSPRRGS